MAIAMVCARLGAVEEAEDATGSGCRYAGCRGAPGLGSDRTRRRRLQRRVRRYLLEALYADYGGGFARKSDYGEKLLPFEEKADDSNNGLFLDSCSGTASDEEAVLFDAEAEGDHGQKGYFCTAGCGEKGLLEGYAGYSEKGLFFDAATEAGYDEEGLFCADGAALSDTDGPFAAAEDDSGYEDDAEGEEGAMDAVYRTLELLGGLKDKRWVHSRELIGMRRHFGEDAVHDAVRAWNQLGLVDCEGTFLRLRLLPD